MIEPEGLLEENKGGGMVLELFSRSASKKRIIPIYHSVFYKPVLPI